MRMRKMIMLGAAGLAMAGMGACGAKATEQYRDAPRQSLDRSPADVITMPDGFSNVAAKCEGSNRVYVIFHNDSSYGSIAVVANDPRCMPAGG